VEHEWYFKNSVITDLYHNNYDIEVCLIFIDDQVRGTINTVVVLLPTFIIEENTEF
jgi:hypothetical protein